MFMESDSEEEDEAAQYHQSVLAEYMKEQKRKAVDN